MRARWALEKREERRRDRRSGHDSPQRSTFKLALRKVDEIGPRPLVHRRVGTSIRCHVLIFRTMLLEIRRRWELERNPRQSGCSKEIETPRRLFGAGFALFLWDPRYPCGKGMPSKGAVCRTGSGFGPADLKKGNKGDPFAATPLGPKPRNVSFLFKTIFAAQLP